MASLVAGGELIAFLDFLFERPITQRNAALVPSFLLDGPWSSLHTPSVEVDKQVEASPLKRRAASPESTAPVPTRVPLYRFEDYSELSQEARDLDAALLPHLRAIITGSKRGLLDHLAFPLFT